MSALPHLLHRLRRRLKLSLLRTRARQLDIAIAHAELQIVTTHEQLAVLRTEANAVRNILRMADAHHPSYSEPTC